MTSIWISLLLLVALIASIARIISLINTFDLVTQKMSLISESLEVVESECKIVDSRLQRVVDRAKELRTINTRSRFSSSSSLFFLDENSKFGTYSSSFYASSVD